MAISVSLEHTVTIPELKKNPDKIARILDQPAFVFMGRSNVGKSSLLNSLSNQKISRLGKRPGLTSFIQVFRVQVKESTVFYYIDCPGFGFVSQGKNREKEYRELIYLFLKKIQIKISVVLFLFDIRRSLDKKSGKNFSTASITKDEQWLMILSELNLPTIIVATKVDKIPKNSEQRALKVIADSYNISPGDIFPVSSKTKKGIKDLLDFLKENFL